MVAADRVPDAFESSDARPLGEKVLEVIRTAQDVRHSCAKGVLVGSGCIPITKLFVYAALFT